ncbi:MAG: hypothetical protein WD794_05045 [Mycobacteriales bacterium]
MRLVEQARTLPVSASAVVHRGELLELLAQLRSGFHAALGEAQALLGNRDDVVEQGRREVERLLTEAQTERVRLVERTSVHREAQAEADRLLAQARAQAAAMQAEVEDYVDGKLANMEVVLTRTLQAVQRGRSRLAGHSELDDLRD